MKIKDIAKLAGVSKSSVSLALNGKPGISEETRMKIVNIAKQYGYSPRPYFKSEDIETSLKIIRFVACTNEGIVTDTFQYQPFFMELISYIEQIVSSKGYSLILSSISPNNLSQQLSRLEQQQKSSGILLLGTNISAEQINALAKQYNNLIILDSYFESINSNFINMNNILGARQAGEFLVKLGHKKIGYVKSNIRMLNFDLRKKAFFEVLEENSIFIDNKYVYSMSPTNIGINQEFKNNILKQKDDLPTALFCECDYMAISVIKTLNTLQIKVPDDISIIGFDNIKEADIINPELTTVHVKKKEIAQYAVEKLINIIENKDEDKIKLLIDTEIVERKSCKRIK